ncbi:toll/interleukin-1 receptor domain-containing protein [bacterium]|nr:toll/interleukin-1 receptor domain-containing protein [bacterium]
MKPIIFLSHSKHDLDFIEQLAHDLRPSRVQVWYDDWEIPPGASLRAKIFDEGISRCDLFFVYLTNSSAKSSWVQQELDAAFVTELESKGGFLALFVDSDETRENLPLDLRSRRLPIINTETYNTRLLELVALAWEGLTRRRTAQAKEDSRIEKLELQKSLLEKELEIERLRSEGRNRIVQVLDSLSGTTISALGRSASASALFKHLARDFALGLSIGTMEEHVGDYLGVHVGKPYDRSKSPEQRAVYEATENFRAALVIQGAIRQSGVSCYLTEIGQSLARSFTDQQEIEEKVARKAPNNANSADAKSRAAD